MSKTEYRGVLVDWNDERGFGFIQPVAGGPKVFAHISSFDKRSGRPQGGDVFDYQVTIASDGRVRADRVRATGAMPDAMPTGPRLAFIFVLGFALLLMLAVLVWGVSPWVAAAYLAMSVITWLLYALDKRAAIAGTWRVSEAKLQTAALLCGWPGAVLAQQLLRHKNRKVGFQWTFWLVVAINVALLTALTVSPEQLEGLVGYYLP